MECSVGARFGAVIAHGGSSLGHIQSAEVPDKGKLTVVHAADPERNIIELQAWR